MIGELNRYHTDQKKQKLLLGKDYTDSGLVCTRLNGSPWSPSNFSSSFTRNLKYHGLPHIRFHDIRHSHATILHELGVDLKDISDRLRHSTLGITADLYTDVTNKRRRQVAQAFAKAIMHARKKSSPRRNQGER